MSTSPPTPPANLTADNDGAFVNVSWDPSTDDLTPQSFIRYDVYVNGELRAVVVGEAIAQVEADYGVNNISIIAVDTADNESTPGTTTLNNVTRWCDAVRTMSAEELANGARIVSLPAPRAPSPGSARSGCWASREAVA